MCSVNSKSVSLQVPSPLLQPFVVHRLHGARCRILRKRLDIGLVGFPDVLPHDPLCIVRIAVKQGTDDWAVPQHLVFLV